jgi:hypothetical protein
MTQRGDWKKDSDGTAILEGVLFFIFVVDILGTLFFLFVV